MCETRTREPSSLRHSAKTSGAVCALHISPWKCRLCSHDDRTSAFDVALLRGLNVVSWIVLNAGIELELVAC
eukprot:2059093-Rhodomonas_salina.1